MRRRRAVGMAVVVVGVWLVTGAMAAMASGTVSDVGWWTRNPLASAPDGGFAVGAAADGPTTVAVVRVDLGDGVDTLVLGAEPTDETAGLASVEICVVSNTWTAAAGESLDDAPQTECSADAVPFARAGDQWRGDVSSLVHGQTGPVSLGVVPTATSGTIPFEAGFGPPTAVASEGSTPSGGPVPTSTSGPGSSPNSPTGTGTVSSPAPPSEFRLSPPAPPATTAEPSPPGATDQSSTSTTTTVATAGPGFEVAATGLLDESSARGARWGEALVLVLIGAAVGGAVYGVSRFGAARA